MSRAHDIRRQAERFVIDNPGLADAIAEVIQEVRMLGQGKLVAGLTPSQARLFDFLLTYTDRYGVSPSYSEICDHVDLCRSNVARLLNKLKERGYINFIKNKHRTITILPAARKSAAAMARSMPRSLAA